MDADDSSIPTRFERQVAFLEQNPDVGVCGTLMMAFGATFGTRYSSMEDARLKSALYFCGNPIAHPTVMLRSKVLRDNGLSYRSEAYPMEDYQLWLDLIPFTKFHVLNEVLLLYRIHPESVGARHRKRQLEMTTEALQRNIASVGGYDLEREHDKIELIRAFFNHKLEDYSALNVSEISTFLDSATAQGFDISSDLSRLKKRTSQETSV